RPGSHLIVEWEGAKSTSWVKKISVASRLRNPRQEFVIPNLGDKTPFPTFSYPNCGPGRRRCTKITNGLISQSPSGLLRHAVRFANSSRHIRSLRPAVGTVLFLKGVDAMFLLRTWIVAACIALSCGVVAAREWHLKGKLFEAELIDVDGLIARFQEPDGR